MFYTKNKQVLGALIMDWLQFLQIVCIPAFGWLFWEVSQMRRELSEFKLKVAEDAKDYATNDAILRMEGKIDDLRNLIIEQFTDKRANK